MGPINKNRFLNIIKNTSKGFSDVIGKSSK